MKARDSQTAEMFKPAAPMMPEGHYSGDKSNPNLRAFVEAHLLEQGQRGEVKGERLADGTLHFSLSPFDSYNVPAFDKPIETTKATAIYNMHPDWSKKPHGAIRQYIRHYTKPGDLVLDPFCGSGGTALAALMEDRKAIAIDRSPAATFITKNYCTPVDSNALQAAFEELKRKVKPEIDRLYETRCDRCGGKVATAYTVYSQVFQCPRCLTKVPLFDCVEVEGETAAGKPKTVNVCPHCHKKGHREVIRSQSEKFGSVPVLVSYLCQSGCKPARDERRHDDPNRKKREYFEKWDLGKLREIETKSMPHWYPRGYDMTGFSRYQRDALYYYDVKEVADLFTKRNLWALASLKSAIEEADDTRAADALRFAFSAILLNCSRLYRYRPSLKGGIAMGTYYLPQDAQIINVWRALHDKVQDVVHGKVQCDLRNICISTQSATELGVILSNTVDYIFTDPPYAEKVQYGELNFVWEAWLGLDTHWHDEEIIVNEIRGKTEVDWANMMRRAIAECYRVLKPGRWLSLCYHDTSEGTWELIQDIMAEAGFIADRADSALFIDTGQKSYNQYTADKVNKRDLVINFRKPKPGEWRVTALYIPADADVQTFRELVRQIIREYLQAHPGTSKDRIYDELVSRMVRAGQMQSHNFDEILREVAVSTEGEREKEKGERWYLKETEESALDEAESALEDAAAQVMAAFIEKRLKDDPSREGVHYSDLFEHYIYAIKEKPRRQLADWLLDYFYKTPEGTYRLPADEVEAKTKAEARASGVHRQIKRFLAYLTNGSAVPERKRPNDATLADWLRQCKRTGLYEQGKLLYEQGGLNLEHLPEEVAANVEEDYQVCVRTLARTGEGQQKKKRGKR